MKDVEAFNLKFVAFLLTFAAVWALLAALWQIVLSYQMHFAPACAPDDADRLSCTYTATATVASINPPYTIFIGGAGFLTTDVELPLGADVSFLHPGDTVTAVEWHHHIVSLTRGGRTLSALGNPDAGPVAWPGVLLFSATFGAIALVLRQLVKRTRVTANPSFWGGG
jgi:hypothetical protein